MRHPEEHATTGGGHPDEGTIHAWLDGALPADEAAALEAHVAGCAACASAVAEARGFLAAASRILGALDQVPGGVLPQSAGTPPGAGRTRPDVVPLRPAAPVVPARRRRAGWTLSAAAVALLALGTWAAVRDGGVDHAMELATSEVPAAGEARPRSAPPPAAMPDAAPGEAAADDPAPTSGFAATAIAPPAPSPAAAPAAPVAPAPAPPPPPAAATAAERAVLLRAPSRLAVGGVTVTGEVTSDAGRPLAGASVAAPAAGGDGADLAARTDTAGRFSLVVPIGTDSLRVRRVGFAPAQVAVAPPVGDTARVRVTLRADARARSDVAVTGAAAGAAAGAPAGCYRVELAGGPAAAADRAERALPGWLVLAPDTMEAAPWHAVRPLPATGEASMGPEAPRGRWRPDGDGALIEWSGAGGDVVLRVRTAGNDLAGTAAPAAPARADAAGVRVTLRRAACR